MARGHLFGKDRGKRGEEHHLVDRCMANLTLLLITAAGTEVAATMIVLRRLRSMVGKRAAC